MTAEVISLAERRAESAPHLVGDARCINCDHEWTGLAPVGEWQLECPACKTLHGVWRFPVGAADGEPVLLCNCGCEALTAYISGGHKRVRCMRCGTDQTDTLFDR